MAAVGLIRVLSNAELDQQSKRAAEARQQEPVIVGLAAHLHRLWTPAWEAKKPIETKMLKALRQRNGEYEPGKLAEIEKQGGSGVFMMITETKCRGAESWLRDVLLDSGDVPWDIQPTPIPDLPHDLTDKIHEKFANKVINTIQQTGQAPNTDLMDELKEAAMQDIRFELLEEAQNRCNRMKTKISDQFTEGGMISGLNEFLSDLTTYPNAFLKGPTVRRQRKLKWVKGADGYTPDVAEDLAPTYRRVDPYRIYPEPGLTKLDEGYVFEHHRLSRPELAELMGVPGYDDDAIRAILAEMPNGGLQNWLWSAELQKATLEQKYEIWHRPTEMIDALEFWGKIPGKDLLEWGMSPEEVPDPTKEYDVNAWMIGRWVIKATLNYDALGKKPYYTTSFVKRPGAMWGIAIPELIEDLQQMCNAAARSLVNNMGIASGPQVEVSVDRLPPDEDITQMYPWKIWQTTSDPLGNNQAAIKFTQPDDRSQALMQVYTHFSKLADDQSGIPAYVYGDMQVGGAGRTASGLSMLMGSAGKGIRQVVMHIDNDVIEPAVVAQYNWNMRYVDDPSIKGDAVISARGAVNLANREQLNVRRVEFLQATANPIDSEIVGKPGRAAILREVAKGLAMPVDDIVPSKEALESQQKIQKAMQASMPPQPQEPGQGTPPGTTPTFPGGAPMGGRDANTVSNQMTGAAA
jgi:hypothetical protein